MSLVARGSGEEDGTYPIWSSGSEDEEMRNPMLGALYANFEEGSEVEETMAGKCFVTTDADKSPMTSKVRNLLESFNIPSSSYHSILYEFNGAVMYVNDLLISASSGAERSKSLMLETQRNSEFKKSRIDKLELELRNVNGDREKLSFEVQVLLK